jgi:hypothetical protein
MKSNFYLNTAQRNQEYHIDLHGVFDGASAFELLRSIWKGDKKGMTMFIDTSHLKATHPFGQAVLESNLPQNGIRAKLHFKGAWAGDILPEGCHLLKGRHEKGRVCTGSCKNCQCRKNTAKIEVTAHNTDAFYRSITSKH